MAANSTAEKAPGDVAATATEPHGDSKEQEKPATEALNGTAEHETANGTAEQDLFSKRTSFSDEDLQNAVDEAWQEDPGLGVPKLLKEIRMSNPGWTLTEKRLRAFLKDKPRPASRPVPVSKNDSRIIEETKAAAGSLLQIRRISDRVGRGVYSTEDIKAGTVLLSEDAFAFVPKDEMAQRVRAGTACGHCGKPWQPGRLVMPSCSLHRPNKACHLKFCTKTCQASHADLYGAHVCPMLNASYTELDEFCQQRDTVVPLVVLQLVLRIAKAYERSDKEGAAEVQRVEAFTAISEATRRASQAEELEPVWKQAHELVLKALHQEQAAQGAKDDLQLKLPGHVLKSLLSYEGFLLMWGRISLNQEADGGLYRIHSNFNHSCAPVAALRRRVEGRNAGDPRPSRIHIVAAQDIAAGNEITLTYVDPRMEYAQRHDILSSDYLFTCQCSRCQQEKGMAKIIAALNRDGQTISTRQINGTTVLSFGGNEGEGGNELDDLLAGLGKQSIEA